MRKFTLLCSALSLMAIGSKAQTVATFDTLTLPGTDTFYINYTHPGADVGFNDGLAHFPCIYDTVFGGIWSTGFSYSNKNDTATSGYMNDHAAKTGTGYGGSGKYAMVWCSDPVSYQPKVNLPLRGIAIGQPVEGFYITNGTYAYNLMRDGDGMTGAYGRKFGDTTGTGVTTGQGTAPDWFKLTVKGYLGGTLKADSVEFYLADFRPAGTANDSIIKGWHWVNLMPLGKVDSLNFKLSSSDNNSGGMKTPSYFCMDNFTTHESALGIHQAPVYAAKVYPNPATTALFVDLTDESLNEAVIVDMTGNVISTTAITSKHMELNTASLATGTYLLKLTGGSNTAAVRFIKN